MGLKRVTVADIWSLGDNAYRVMHDPVEGFVTLQSINPDPKKYKQIIVPVSELRRQFKLEYESYHAIAARGAGKSSYRAIWLNLGAKGPTVKKHSGGSQQSRWRIKEGERV